MVGFSADLDRLEPRTPAQRVDRMAAGREQVAAAALARPDPVPTAVPIGDLRQILRARKADIALPASAQFPVILISRLGPTAMQICRKLVAILAACRSRITD